MRDLDFVKQGNNGKFFSFQEEVDELTGEIRRKNMLDQYDEEMFGEQKSSFTIGRDGQFNEEEAKEKERQKIKAK